MVRATQVRRSMFREFAYVNTVAPFLRTRVNTGLLLGSDPATRPDYMCKIFQV
jgi:hypothetical protein